MPKIVIQNLHNKEIFTENADNNLLDIIHENYIDWMHACGGKGRCTTCKVIIVDGSKNLSELTISEIKFINANRLKEGERLACQSKPIGDLLIRVADENKFTHINYSE